MTASYVASAAGSASVVAPAGIVAGDFLVMWVANNASAGYAGANAPTGFTNWVVTGTGSSLNVGVYYKIADGTEGGTTISLSSSPPASVSILGVYRGYDQTKAPDSSPSQENNASAATSITSRDGSLAAGPGIRAFGVITDGSGAVGAADAGVFSGTINSRLTTSGAGGAFISLWDEHYDGSGSTCQITFSQAAAATWRCAPMYVDDLALVSGNWTVGCVAENAAAGWSAGLI